MKNLLRFLVFFLIVTQIGFAQWYPPQPFTNLNLNNACYESEGNIFVVGEFGSIYSSTNNGNTWQSIYIPDTGTLNSLCIIDDTFGYVVGDYGKIFRINFSSIVPAPEDISIVDFFNLKDVAFLDYYNGIVVGTKQVRIDGRTYFLPSIHITTNAGLNWIEKCFDVRGKINSVSYFEENNILAVGDSGKVLISNDDGYTWTPLDLGIYTNLYEIKFCPNNIGIIVGELGTVIISEDGWQTWSIINVPEYYHINSVCYKDINQFVAAGYMSVRIDGRDFNVATIFSSDDGGINWNEAYVPQRGIYNTASFCNPNLAIAVGDSGLFSIYESPTALDYNNLTLSDFVLEQNFPNPFNPITTIKYQIPHRSTVSLKVYDIIGNQMVELVNEEQEVGYYNAEFNASNLPSGVYFYRIQASSFIETKKMLLLK